jgi:putative endonuclease
MDRLALGKMGEQFAAEYLAGRGYRIVDRNIRIGRGEIDIVAQDGETWVFVEVKTGRKSGFGEPEERVTLSKQRQLGRLAQQYLEDHQIHDAECRFDVVAVTAAGNNWTVRHIPDAFWLERD